MILRSHCEQKHCFTKTMTSSADYMSECVYWAGQWKEASRQRELLLAYLQQQSGAGTMLDTRRLRDYDADALVDQYLNLKDVQVPLVEDLGKLHLSQPECTVC